jgi:hypothetical protein
LRPASSCPSGDDTAVDAGFVDVDGDCFLGFEVQIALDGQAEFATYGGEFDEAHIEVRCIFAFVHCGALCAAVGEELFGE